ncbi:MAG: hypothetical protein R3F29_15270, partial [Planctomycetota bacterium]
LLEEPPQMTIRFVGKNGELWPEPPAHAGGNYTSRGGDGTALPAFLSRLQGELRHDSRPFRMRVLSNPLRVPKLAIPGHTAVDKYRIGGRVFEVEMIAGGEATVVVDG